MQIRSNKLTTALKNADLLIAVAGTLP